LLVEKGRREGGRGRRKGEEEGVVKMA